MTEILLGRTRIKICTRHSQIQHETHPITVDGVHVVYLDATGVKFVLMRGENK